MIVDLALGDLMIMVVGHVVVGHPVHRNRERGGGR